VSERAPLVPHGAAEGHHRGLRALGDRALRLALGAPGVLVDLIDGAAVPATGPDAATMYPLVAAAARHPEAHLALEDGLHYHVHGRAVLAYQVRGGTAFAIGGLNAPPGERVALLASFAEACRGRGVQRSLAFPLREPELDEAREAGFTPVQVGVEAWLDLTELGVTPGAGAPFGGRRYAQVRYMRRRAGRHGVVVCEVRPGECDDELVALHAAWLQSKRPSWRMRLLVGSPGVGRPFDRRYVVAKVDDRVVAFVTLLPGGPRIWGLDVMCRGPGAPAGTMECLLAHVAERLGAEGAEVLSLGPCPMAGVPRDDEHRALTAIFDVLYSSDLGNQVFGFRSLHRFKSKFRPRWEPVYFAAAPRLGPLALYLGCRMWGLY
jgi:lysylphosphatidylglycerol synthetase-like protein (DUF2156 family)